MRLRYRALRLHERIVGDAHRVRPIGYQAERPRARVDEDDVCRWRGKGGDRVVGERRCIGEHQCRRAVTQFCGSLLVRADYPHLHALLGQDACQRPGARRGRGLRIERLALAPFAATDDARTDDSDRDEPDDDRYPSEYRAAAGAGGREVGASNTPLADIEAHDA